MKYTMKGQEYTLPEVDQATDIVPDGDEAGRIRWLASYSKNEKIYEQSRALVRLIDKKEYSLLGDTLVCDGLLFKNRLDSRVVHGLSLSKSNERRDAFLAYILPRLEQVNPQIAPLVLRYTRQWFAEDKHDAWFWGNTNDTNEQIEYDLQGDIKMYARRDGVK